MSELPLRRGLWAIIWFLCGQMEDCVQERLEEINAEAEAYDRDATKLLTRLAERLGFEWPGPDGEGLTVEHAAELFYGYIAELTAELKTAEQRSKELEAVIQPFATAWAIARERPLTTTAEFGALALYHLDGPGARFRAAFRVLNPTPARADNQGKS